ncbi:MAG TPA: lipase maturation factor family protein, partial [Candidatus Polarisedimenticolia bacterium]|nr:lipase maturation factor family protein [Candidatus Polarisedimenticolia bacterium]
MQLAALVGSRGLLPLGEYLGRYQTAGAGWLARLYDFPTLLWIAHPDWLLTALPLAGAALAILLILGVGGRVVPALLWLLYLSSVVAARDFFYYQWDNLLLETTFLAIFLPARGTLAGAIRRRPLPEPSPVVVFLLRWVLFRLLFESALAKILYGREDWLTLRGMTYYYETAPLPSWGGWLVQQQPLWFHQGSVLYMFLVELLLPFFIFLPRRFRIAFFLLHLPFQISIGLTSNYGFFNLLSLVLSLLVLEDRDLEGAARLWRRLRRRAPAVGAAATQQGAAPPAPAAGAATPAGRPGVGGPAPAAPLPWPRRMLRHAPWLLAACIVPASLMEASGYLLRGTAFDRALVRARALYAPLRTVNVYHLFPGIVRQRIVAEIEGTQDGASWVPYRLRYAPGDPGAAPPMTWLHNPRFPFNYSFFTLGRGRRDVEYLENLARRLCCDPGAVAGLMEPNALLESRPQALRMSYYRYRFGTWSDLRA